VAAPLRLYGMPEGNALLQTIELQRLVKS
jgi:hypothetical protein